MAGGKLDKWQGGSLAKGVNVNSPDFHTDIELTAATVNATSGVFQGIGPRYGTAPVPGHNYNIAVASLQNPGLQTYESGFSAGDNAGWGTSTRTGGYAVYPIRMTLQGVSSSVSTYYAWVQTFTTSAYHSSTSFYQVVFSSVFENSGNIYDATVNIYDGLSDTTVNQSSRLTYLPLSLEYIPNGVVAETSAATDVADRAKYVVDKFIRSSNFASTTPYSVTGADIPMKWVYGKTSSVPSGSVAPNGVLEGYLIPWPLGGSTIDTPGGIPSSFNLQNYPAKARSLNVYCLDSGVYQTIDYNVQFVPTSNIYISNPLNSRGASSIGLAGLAVTKAGAGTTYNLVNMALYNDDLITTNSSYQGVMIADQGAFCTIVQDAYRDPSGLITQYVDLTNIGVQPLTMNTNAIINEDTPTGYAYGPANSGLLRQGQSYEIVYSVYDKRLNYETNVCSTPFQIYVPSGANDFLSLIIFDSASTTGKTMFYSAAVSARWIITYPGVFSLGGPNPNIGPAQHLNFLEYRFYYRALGSVEWLPALFVDAAKFWFYPHWTGTGQTMTLCSNQTAIGGLIGGRPGGFQDYSPLPKDNYTCVVIYKNRAFWLSNKALNFSRQNNLLAYPGANSAACPVGSFKGAIVQAYYGQAEQDARLVVFGTAGTYVGKFTGNLQNVPVQVSPTTVANFGLDGSDFVLNAWTSVTAFSYRSAVVGEGILYFWGPQGAFMDDGVNPIQRISIPLEPAIFTLYDPSLTDTICCNYNDTTKEVCWFYTPKTADSTYPSYGLIWNTVHKTWLMTKMLGQVDAAQSIKIDTPMPTAGNRALLWSRAFITTQAQRAFFFDQMNTSGDMFNNTELMVKSISTPSTGVRRLTLAAGFSAGLSAVNAGDVIAVSQCAAYTNGALATPSDFMAAIKAVNSGAGTIDITLPTGATLDGSATIANNFQFFPIWHAAGKNGAVTGIGLNAFAYSIDTKFWIPAGMSYWAFWLYAHLVFKLNVILPGPAQTLAFSYATPISGANIQTDTLTFVNNSANNFQVLHPLPAGQSNFEGQGLKITFSGIQLANSWILQFIETYAQMKDGLQLKHFEG